MVTHSSQPNAYFAWNAVYGFSTTYAISDNDPGKEIPISYCDPFLSFSERKSQLARYSFSCCFDQANEDRLGTIRRLKSEIVRNPMRLVETFGNLLEVVDLIEREGLLSLDLANHYRHLAESSYGDKPYTEAIGFTEKALEIVHTCVGYASEDFDKMKRFVHTIEAAEGAAGSKGL